MQIARAGKARALQECLSYLYRWSPLVPPLNCSSSVAELLTYWLRVVKLYILKDCVRQIHIAFDNLGFTNHTASLPKSVDIVGPPDTRWIPVLNGGMSVSH